MFTNLVFLGLLFSRTALVPVRENNFLKKQRRCAREILFEIDPKKIKVIPVKNNNDGRQQMSERMETSKIEGAILA